MWCKNEGDERMKCVECPYHSEIDDYYWCDVKPKEPKRIRDSQAAMDLYCDEYEERSQTDKLKC